MESESLEAYFRYVTSPNAFVKITLDDLMMNPDFESILEMSEGLIAKGFDEAVVRKSFTMYVMTLAVRMFCDMHSHVGNFMGMTVWC